MSDDALIDEQLRAAFPTLPPASSSRAGVIQYRVAPAQLLALASCLHRKLQGRLALLFALDGRPIADRYEIQYLFGLGSRGPWVLLTLERTGVIGSFHRSHRLSMRRSGTNEKFGTSMD